MPALSSAASTCGFVSPVPLAGLKWVSVYEQEFGHEDMLTGIYLVRDKATLQLACVQLNGPMWSSPIAFDEYAFVAPQMEGWNLIR
jgi:hypothetical protein